MIRQRILSTLMRTTALKLMVIVALSCTDGVATAAPEWNVNTGDQKDSKKTASAEVDALAVQVKELQKQVAELQARAGALPTPRIVAAGTATFQLGKVQDNATNVRVPLSGDIAARLGEDYIVLLTNRFPTGGFPFFAPYWKRAKDGFDITLVDVTLGPNSTVSNLYNRNKTFLIDWIVVKK